LCARLSCRIPVGLSPTQVKLSQQFVKLIYPVELMDKIKLQFIYNFLKFFFITDIIQIIIFLDMGNIIISFVNCLLG
jgi:hypothetical protein